MQYTLRRVLFGAGIVLLGRIMGFMCWAAISGEARPGGINPLIKLAMIVIGSGMAVGCTVCGLYVLCTAFLPSRPKVGATAEATARGTPFPHRRCATRGSGATTHARTITSLFRVSRSSLTLSGRA